LNSAAEHERGEARVICHFDLDYFFAQCEERRQPQLREKPVVVCVFSGRSADSGAVSTANYVARRAGVKSGMPIFQAKRLLEGSPDAVFLPVDHAYYSTVSQRVMNILQSHADRFEQNGIDEAYLEVTGRVNGDFNRAAEHAADIKREIREKEGLLCSVGIGPNKLVAKIASDFRKPDGLTVVKPGEVQGFLANLEVGKLPGVGKKTEGKLRELGVRTIGDLARLDGETLMRLFGKALGVYFLRAARGVYDEPVQAREGRDQLSRMETLKRSSLDVEFIQPEVEKLCESLYERLREENLAYECVSIMVVLDDLTMHSKSRTLEIPATSLQTMKETAYQLLTELLEAENTLKVRRIGVRLSNLIEMRGQTTLGAFLQP